MLKEKQKTLRELAKTEKYDKQDTLASLAVQRLNQLYLAKEFGPHNATSVVNALCFSFVVNLKVKKAIDHKQLLWGDIVLCKNPNDEEYLCYKPLPGYEYCRLPLRGISGHRLVVQDEESQLWDPVSIYKLYSSKRPITMKTQHSPFYLGVAMTAQEGAHTAWYKPVAMGVNKLNDLVRMIRDITGSLPNTQPFKSPCHSDSPDDTSLDGRNCPYLVLPRHHQESLEDSLDAANSGSDKINMAIDVGTQPSMSSHRGNAQFDVEAAILNTNGGQLSSVAADDGEVKYCVTKDEARFVDIEGRYCIVLQV